MRKLAFGMNNNNNNKPTNDDVAIQIVIKIGRDQHMIPPVKERVMLDEKRSTCIGKTGQLPERLGRFSVIRRLHTGTFNDRFLRH